MKYSTGVRKLVSIILEKNCCISVHDGEEWACKKSYDKAEIVACVLSVEECTLRVRDGQNDEFKGSFVLVCNGNADDAIANYSDNEFCNEVCELYGQVIKQQLQFSHLTNNEAKIEANKIAKEHKARPWNF